MKCFVLSRLAFGSLLLNDKKNHVFWSSKLKEIDTRPMYIVFARFYFGENCAPLKAEQIEIVVQVNSDFAQNGNRKYDGETSESVPYSSLAFRSHLHGC